MDSIQEDRKRINRNSLISICLVGGSALITCVLLQGIPTKPWVLLLLFASPYFFLPIFFIVGIILGHVALRQIKKNKERGKIVALCSITFGYFVIVATLLSLLMTDFVAH